MLKNKNLFLQECLPIFADPAKNVRQLWMQLSNARLLEGKNEKY